MRQWWVCAVSRKQSCISPCLVCGIAWTICTIPLYSILRTVSHPPVRQRPRWGPCSNTQRRILSSFYNTTPIGYSSPSISRGHSSPSGSSGFPAGDQSHGHPWYFTTWCSIPGWDIMGCESETLPSYHELRNCSYSVKLITTLPLLHLFLIYRVLIPSEHYPARTRHPLRICAKCIDRTAGYPLLYGHLPPIYVYSNGVEPWRVHRLLYRWILPLSAGPTFCCHPRDPSRRSMVVLCQNLEHLPIHHPTLASIE